MPGQKHLRSSPNWTRTSNLPVLRYRPYERPQVSEIFPIYIALQPITADFQCVAVRRNLTDSGNVYTGKVRTSAV